MRGKLGIERLFGWARARPEAEPVDPADVGTAFGMELSIENRRKLDDDGNSSSVAPTLPTGTPAASRKSG
jgi:hypothetical protein